MAGKGGARGSPKSPRKLPNRGGGGAIPPAEATERPQAPTSFLMLSVPLTDERLHIGSGAALVISDFPIFPPPVPRDVALEPAQGKLSPLCAHVAGVRRAVQISRTFQDFLRVLGILESSRARRRTSTSAPSSSSRSLMRRRWCERSASSSASSRGRLARGGLFQKPCLHASEGRRGSHLEQLRRVFLSIWDHSSIWRAFFLFSAFACEDFCSLPRGSRRGAPAPHAAESRGRPAPAPSAAPLDLAHCDPSSAPASR